MENIVFYILLINKMLIKFKENKYFLGQIFSFRRKRICTKNIYIFII